MKTIPDISERSYNNRTFPDLYLQEDVDVPGGILVKDNMYMTYEYSYEFFVELAKTGKINMMRSMSMRQALLFD